MSDRFDAHYTWLGIPPSEQPPDHYRLLGIRTFENNAEVISNALEQRAAHLRSYLSGPRAAEAQQILDELVLARDCLSTSEKKVAYDRKLRQKDAPKLSRGSWSSSHTPVKPPAPHKSGAIAAPSPAGAAATAPPAAPASPVPPPRPAKLTSPHVPPQPAVRAAGTTNFPLLAVSAVAGVFAVGLILAIIVVGLAWWLIVGPKGAGDVALRPVGPLAPGHPPSIGPGSPGGNSSAGSSANSPNSSDKGSEVGDPERGNPALNSPGREPVTPTALDTNYESWPEFESRLTWRAAEPGTAAQIATDRGRVLAGLATVPCSDLIAAFMGGVLPTNMPGPRFGGPVGPGGSIRPGGAIVPGGAPGPGGPFGPGGFGPGGVAPSPEVFEELRRSGVFGPGELGGPMGVSPPLPELGESFLLTGTVRRIRHLEDGVWLSLASGAGSPSAPGFPALPLVLFENPAVAPLLADFQVGDPVRVAVRRVDWSKQGLSTASTSTDVMKSPFVDRYGHELRLFAAANSPAGVVPRWVFVGSGIQKDADSSTWVDSGARRAELPENLEALERSLAWRTRGATVAKAVQGKIRGTFASASEGAKGVYVSLRPALSGSDGTTLSATFAPPVRLDEFADYSSGTEIVAYGQIAPSTLGKLTAVPVGMNKATPDPELAGGTPSISLVAMQKSADPASLVRSAGPRRENLDVSLEAVHGKVDKHLGKSVRWRGSLQRVCRYKGETHLLIQDPKGYRRFECYVRDAQVYQDLADYRDGRGGEADVVLVVGKIGDQDAALFRVDVNRSAPLIELHSVQRVNYAPSLVEVGKPRGGGTFEHDRVINPADELARDIPRRGEWRSFQVRFDSFNEYDQTLSVRTEGLAMTRLKIAFPDLHKADFADYRRNEQLLVTFELEDEPRDFQNESSLKWKGRTIQRLEGSLAGPDGVGPLGARPPAFAPRSTPKPKESRPLPLDQTNEKQEEVAAARLQVGLDLEDLGNTVAARKIYREVIARFPKTAAADQARTLLQPLK